ncbi:enoyl-CoA hydratase/isomerase family protein [Necator americanus]|uniref:3-hydroxyisobutyryl-CoA hydrolase, mitochondrial n=1 Tax=Necator americanus TaxID=51031 RepID=W2T9U8_NECAM|nr:enoyl-CoA hydratase/isomerase family protein [Necator americanus]ETN78364.1 enoyl-CoA hydratase/isomerase family protein [Necator americanus]
MLSTSLLQRITTVHAKNLLQMAMSSSASEVLIENHGSKRVLTLNRPKALNALNIPMIREMYPRMREWEDTKDVNMIILKGSGEKAFCAGGDVLEALLFREEYHLNHLIGSLSKPFVAFIDGIVMGGGCGLSVNGKFRVGTERTMLAMPETALGLFPDVGGSYFLSRLKNNLGLYLALTGYRLQGADAFHAGLATHFVPSSKLGDLQKKLLSLDAVTDKTVDTAIREFQPSNIPHFSLEQHIPVINRTFHAKSVEEVLENLRKENSEWSKKQLETLAKMSPTSLKVTFKQLENGAKMSFDEVFTMEYRLTQRCLEDHDFYEGCRAILIDKDRNPKWKPTTLKEVTDEKVAWYFAPLDQNQDIFVDGLRPKL